MLSILLATLALTPADSIGIGAPIYCPETEARYTLLLPRDGAADVPTNAKIWLTENPALSGGAPELIEAATGSTVAYDLEAIPSKRYTLIRLTPRQLLEADTKYELKNASRAGLITSLTTADAIDDEAPRTPPNAQGTGTHDGCTGYGLQIWGAATSNEDVLVLAETPEAPKDLLSFGTFGSVHIPAEEGELVRYDLVAVDVAGNRSEALTTEAIAEPNDGGGCTCVGARRPHALLALPLLVLLALSRGRCRGSSSRSKRSRSRRASC